MPATTNYDIMDGKFGSGKAAMIINGPWGVQNYVAKKINFGVAPLPTLPNGKAPTPFVGVQMLGVNSQLQERQGGVGSRPLSEHQSPAAAVPGVGTSAGDRCCLECEDRQVEPGHAGRDRVVEQWAADAQHPGDGRGLDAAASVLQLLVKGEVTAA